MIDREKFNDGFLDAQREVGDLKADRFVQQIFNDPERKAEFYRFLSGTADLQQETLPPELPDWADPILMKTGSDFFIRNSEIIMSLLGLLSLPYCYCAADGAMVLYQSEKIRRETTKRLYETAIFVWEVMAPDAFKSDGKGFEEVLKIRLLHAVARYHMLNSAHWNPSWGTPVNQEDMSGTNLAFSLIVLRGMRKLSIPMKITDQRAFMHLWSVIGFLMGLGEGLIPGSTTEAELLDQAISRRQFRSSDHGKELTRSLINHIVAVNKNKVAEKDIMGLMKKLLGTDAASMLAIDCADLPWYKLNVIKAIHILKSLKPISNMKELYQQKYAAFQLLKPA